MSTIRTAVALGRVVGGRDREEEEEISGWLDPGEHALDVAIVAEVDAQPDGEPYGDPETSFVYAFLFMELFAPGDVNHDGVVGVNDLVAVVTGWSD